jgi:hypothetical protein
MDIQITQQGAGRRPYKGTVNGTEFTGTTEFCTLVAQKATPEDGCIHGIGTVSQRGYYKGRFNGTSTNQHAITRAVFDGLDAAPEGLQAAHGPCNNRACVNPHHISFATAASNQQDRLRDGTDNSGEKHGRSKVTDVGRDEICRLYATGDWTLQALGDKFGLDCSQVHYIVNAPTWEIAPMTEEVAVFIYRLAWSTKKFTMREIAEYCQTTPQQVKNIKHGLSWAKQTGYYSSEMYHDKMVKKAA